MEAVRTVAALLLCVAGAGQWCAVNAQSAASRAEQEVRQAVQALDAAAASQDPAALRPLWADDIILTGPDGRVFVGREAALAVVAPDSMKGLKATYDDVRIRVYGNTAVVTGRSTVSGERDGTSVNQQLRYTDVFVKHGGRWLLVADQLTPVAK